MSKINLAGCGKEAIENHLLCLGVTHKQLNMRVNQLWTWIYNRGCTDFSDMSNISKELRNLLEEKCSLKRPMIVKDQLSKDGTRKWLMRLDKNERDKTPPEVETVFIPEEDRGTLCVSTQIGCTLNCKFCHTGTQPLVRNLTAQEIVFQMLVARDCIGDWHGSGTRKITNIVFMGMGEPLYNFDNVKEAIKILNSETGLSFSSRRITLSTSGVVPMIEACGREMGVMLAISLHATRNDLRDDIVPINRKYPIEQLLDACKRYPKLSNSRRITFEYVMLKDVNDSDKDAYALINLISGIPAKINLIPFNYWPGSQYHCSTDERIEAFAKIINRAGYASPVRRPRGQDIMAACGQLKSLSQKRSAYDFRASAHSNV